ncbi:unknown protein [Cronobacter turicensis z3032]|uniref:Uncharacterized protein n=1 Tax=Cronobacter turicensis (strain DSM 18703 / CCUG 55852 / LMG 23827 / z3032) TaxID=693216 RepID=C9Y126_CROTZ|nr:unknown protein [Cronobacter turicensis z3032]
MVIVMQIIAHQRMILLFLTVFFKRMGDNPSASLVLPYTNNLEAQLMLE